MKKTRDNFIEEILAIQSNHIVLSVATGVGKSRAALEKVKALPTHPGRYKQILVVAYTTAVLSGWNDEITKWDATQGICYTFSTYKSLDKFILCNYDMIILDEGHHITERVLEILRHLKSPRVIVLSATLKPSLLYSLTSLYPDLKTYRVRTAEAIESGILPDPKIFLWPLRFNTVDQTETIIKNPKATKYTIQGIFSRRTLYKDKQTKYIIPCTESQYYLDLDIMVDWYKRKAMGGNQVMKNLWLHKAGERLKWLASKKDPYVKVLLNKLKNERTLTFCASIEQAEQLGSNCIHSKNKKAIDTLKSFNEKKVKHITAVAMLDEGVNLVDCRVGIFANINSSERIQIQRVGRILRHPSPIIIIPYFKNSREEEIIDKMLLGYNPDLVKTIQSIDDLKLD